MRNATWLGKLAVVLCGAMLFGPAWGDDGFYVIAGGRNPNITTTNSNTAIGVGAFNANSTGNDNTAIGTSPLNKNTDGYSNTASGSRALLNNTTGCRNTANGTDALHDNTTGIDNTAIGISALNKNTDGYGNTASGSRALLNNTTGFSNTANGLDALHDNTTSHSNTANGRGALYHNTTGNGNTASGTWAIHWNTTGYSNTANGDWALFSNTTGYGNTAIGAHALYTSCGNNNIALGHYAGFNGNPDDSFEGNCNIYIGQNVSPGSLTESGTIRIGNSNQSQTFIAGILNANIGEGTTVYVNGAGQLGTIASSRRYKEDIQDMGDASSGLLQLRPVSFHYKPEYASGSRTLQYGLIAEEVAKVYPELVQYDPKTGEPQTVLYHLVNAMLLNEVKKQEKKIKALEEQNKELSALREQVNELSALKEQVRALSALVAQNQESSLRLAKLED